MPEFSDNEFLQLRDGVTLRSVGVSGEVDDPIVPASGGDPTRSDNPVFTESLASSGIPDDAAARLRRALDAAGFEHASTLPLPRLDARPGAPLDVTRGDDDVPRLELTVDGPDEGQAQVALETDHTGVLRWHFAETPESVLSTTRANRVQTFVIPVEAVEVDAGPADERGWVSFGAKKVIHFLRFPLRAVAGRVATTMVAQWESSHRPYQLRSAATPGELRSSPGLARGATAFASHGPILLLVHGTFSTAKGGFAGLADDEQLMRELTQRYDGRILAFDHPTVSASPRANIEWLLGQLPPGPIEVDVVAHSRGGLVARNLLDSSISAAVGRDAPTVRSIVHVATPNQGTTLAESERIGSYLDVVTNLMTFLPDEPLTTALELVIEVVKQVAIGMVDGLDGLAAMNPSNEGLAKLNEQSITSSTMMRAIASDYEPGTDSLPLTALDALVDQVFRAANDLVVPTDGVARIAGHDHELFTVPGGNKVSHTRYFYDDDVRHRLAEWLPG